MRPEHNPSAQTLLMDELHSRGTRISLNFQVIRLCVESAERSRQLLAYIKQDPEMTEDKILRKAQELHRTIPLTPEEEEENRPEDED